MRIDIWDHDFNRVASYETWVSLVWKECYNSDGQFQLEIVETADAYDISKQMYATFSESDQVMIILSINSRGKYVVFSGKPATWILSRRISQTFISNQNAEQAMRSIISSMEAWPNFGLGDSAGLTDTYHDEYQNDTILKYCEAIGAKTDMGFKVIKVGKAMKFVCYKPVFNKNAKYSEDYGNVGDVVWSTSDQDYCNVIKVVNTNEDYQRSYWVGDTEAAGDERFEKYLEVSLTPEEGEQEAAFAKRIQNEGVLTLLGTRQIETIEFNVEDDRAKLGDIINARLTALRMNLRIRITSVSYKSQRNKVTRTIGVGEPILKGGY